VPNLYAQTLKRAAQVVGGTGQLALRLKVTPSHLARWLGGVERAPADVFLKAVDLLNEEDAHGDLLNEQDPRSNLSR
jgi:hypothetical protein